MLRITSSYPWPIVQYYLSVCFETEILTIKRPKSENFAYKFLCIRDSCWWWILSNTNRTIKWEIIQVYYCFTKLGAEYLWVGLARLQLSLFVSCFGYVSVSHYQKLLFIRFGSPIDVQSGDVRRNCVHSDDRLTMSTSVVVQAQTIPQGAQHQQDRIQ